MQKKNTNSADSAPTTSQQVVSLADGQTELSTLDREKLPALQTQLAIELVDVLVVGAGPAGLACMRRLHEQSGSCRAVLAEASNSIGGRVRGALNGDPHQVPREAGAEFAYQDLLAALGELGVSVSQSELIPVAPYSREAMCIFDGEKMQDANQFFGKVDPDEIRNQLFSEMKEFGRDISLEEFLTNHSAIFRHLTQDHPQIADIIRQGLIGEYACQSLSEMGIAVCADQAEEDQEVAHHNTLSGDVFRVAGGYSSLIEKLGTDLDIRKTTPVEAIEYLANGSLLVTARDSRLNQTCCFVAKQVVLAVPVPTLFKITLPAEINVEQIIQQATKGTYHEGHVVKVVFKSTKPLLPDDKEALAIAGKPVEVWQRKISDEDYQCTLWIAGPAAIDFELKSAMGVKTVPSEGADSSATSTRLPTQGKSGAHKLVYQMISEVFGEGSADYITRMSILPWHKLKHAGHAYRTVKPTGESFEKLEQPHFIELGPQLFLTGADINLATVPSALKGGTATADLILRRNQ